MIKISAKALIWMALNEVNQTALYCASLLNKKKKQKKLFSCFADA